MKIGIVLAMDEELDSILPYLSNRKDFRLFDLDFYSGNISNCEVILVKSGVGKVNSSRATQILIGNLFVDYIINIGVAGGIDEILNVGDIVLGTKLIQHDFDITAFNHNKGYINSKIGDYIESDIYLNSLFLEANKDKSVRIVEGIIASGDIFITDYSMSKKINTKFNALATEMEGAAIAQVCYLSNIPFVIIRSISDVVGKTNLIEYDKFLENNCSIVSKLLVKMLDLISKNNINN